jgi:hypothetical protein
VPRYRLRLTKRLALWSATALVAASLAAAQTPAAAQMQVPANTVTVDVSGSSLANMTSIPLSLTPAFDPAITDYVLRCQTGINAVRVTLFADGATIRVLGLRGASVAIQEDLVENEALVIVARAPRSLMANQPSQADFEDENARVSYWIRCLPHDFPQLKVTKPGSPSPGWYLTGNVNSIGGSGAYAMVLDANGTPVWYQPTTRQALNVTPLSDDRIAWMSSAGPGFAAFEIYSLSSQSARWLAAPTPPTDFHELHPMPNGDLMMLSDPLTPNVDLSSLGFSASATIFDCLLQEVDPQGRPKWQWRASDHISPSDSTHPFATQASGQPAYDVFHCNSIDTDPSSGNVLLSARQTDSVYLIDRKGTILWKMGGNSLNLDGAQTLTITGDPQGAFHAQHDARFQPGGDVSLYDNQSWNASLAARGLVYHVDARAGTATLVWSYSAPDGHNASATGSFRRLSGGDDNVIGWGAKRDTLFTEVNAEGKILLEVTFPSGEFAYRVIKTAVRTFDHSLLRATAGLTPRA